MDIILPKVALTMTGATILEWFCQPGNQVHKGDPLFSFETDKTAIDVDAPADGRLARILVAAGQEAPAGSVVAVLEVVGDQPEPATATAPAAPVAVAVAPAAAELAAALGMDLATITGSGTAGRILEGDVIAAASARAPRGTQESALARGVASASSMGDVPATIEVAALDFSKARRASLPTLERSREVPVFQVGGSIDFGPRWAEMAEHSVSVIDVLSIAAARALRQHPTCHARMRDGNPETYLRPRIGILIRQGDALIPLVFDDPSADTAVAFHARRREVQDAAAGGRVDSANVETPTFVISNLGHFRVEWFTAMLYPDTAVTLALAATGSAGRARTEATVVLTCDHRLADGVDAARFMQSVREAILDIRITAEG
jgi:pyruvate dehydrogenase E2 component (dihydrolipoamide acetyltransferase)